jgi:transcriptional antiterminator RfaH
VTLIGPMFCFADILDRTLFAPDFKMQAARCKERQVECFLPLYSSRRTWKNRCTVEVEIPLFPNYFFAQMPVRDRVRVLSVPGVVSIVSAGTQLLPVPEDYISSLRDGLRVHKIEPHPHLAVGELVRINTGPFAGSEGILERRKTNLRVVLRLGMLARNVSLEVAVSEIEALRSKRKRLPGRLLDP